MIDFITVHVGHVVNEVESLHLRMLYIIMYLKLGFSVIVSTIWC